MSMPSALRRETLRYQGPAILWALVIFLSSSLPSSAIPDIGIFHYDKAIHAAIFFVFTWFLYRALTHTRSHPFLIRHARPLAWLIAAGYGALDEMHQLFVPGRSSDIADFAADAIGVSLCLLVLWWRERRRAGQTPAA
jgi:VanZ family protein